MGMINAHLYFTLRLRRLKEIPWIVVKITNGYAVPFLAPLCPVGLLVGRGVLEPAAP